MKSRFSAFCCMLLTCLFSQAQQLVLPGDHPDPSVVKIGNSFWASATTSNWFPAFPLLKSNDLVHWKQQGYVFDKKPDWADYYFWAPEISYDRGKIYVYYAAHKKNGNLCVGVASADRPEGPYKDHGPLVCQEAGSIDAFPMRDNQGKLYLIWKEDANSVGKPTPIWISEMNEDRTALTGEKRELFRNDQPWEKNLVEGVSIVKHAGYFYAIYAAAGCCGAGCTYVTGVARAKDLLGPWEKEPRNPVMTSETSWVCPGHGTAIENSGRFYFLYHAYRKATNAYTGREGLLRPFVFTNDGWIRFQQQTGKPSLAAKAFSDEFVGARLANSWQWSVFQDVISRTRNGQLFLNAIPGTTGAYIGQKTLTGDYRATAGVLPDKCTALAGIAAIGDDKNMVRMLVNKNMLQVYRLRNGKDSLLASASINNTHTLYLQMQVKDGYKISFHYSTDGNSYIPIGDGNIDGSYLPPWDRAVRAGLVSKGMENDIAAFENFSVKNITAKK